MLDRAIVLRPQDARLRLKLANLQLDSYDFEDAATTLETAVALDPGLAGAAPRLAHCYNSLGRPADTLAILGDIASDFERGSAFERLGRTGDAEREYRAVLAENPHNRPACRRLGKLLIGSGRATELVALCTQLSAAGADNAQLFYTWGTALALDGQIDEARALLVDAARIVEVPLSVSDDAASLPSFNAALAEEILSNPHRLSRFPTDEQANRGSSRVHALGAGRRPELMATLFAAIEDAIEAYDPPRCAAFDPWLDARPNRAELSAWGLIQRDSDYEEWHLHPAGWLSGVYYVKVPASVSADGAGPGCIEFGPPGPVARALPDLVPIIRHLPVEGTLLLAPSLYRHRTLPTGADDYRVSFAFDVVPLA